MCAGPDDSVPLTVPPESSESLADAAPRAIRAAIAAAASWRLEGVVLVAAGAAETDAGREAGGVVKGAAEINGACLANDI